jgi:hypothetical protein
MTRRLVQIAAQDPHSPGPIAPKQQVHQQEGDVILDIDIAELIIELDTVKGDRLILFNEDITQMQVAVAAPPKA